MSIIQRIFKEHGDAYIRHFANKVPMSHRKIIRAICECRSGLRGQHLFSCPDCGEEHVANSSCGNRHCPVCQNEKAAKWVHQQQIKCLPCNYFLVTFTVPRELLPVTRKNQSMVYKALFDAASQSLKTLLADSRFTGCAESGFFGVLHTWTQDLSEHPHIHFVVPGGGLSKDRTTWISAKKKFLLHVKPLSKMFRLKMKAAFAQAGIAQSVPKDVWHKDWVVHCKSVGDGKHVMKYLGAYVFRVAVSNARIKNYDGKIVTFTGKRNGKNGKRVFTIPVFEFMRKFLLHALPRGFRKIRYYGFLSPNFGVSLEKVREMICVLYEIIKQIIPSVEPIEKSKPLLCPKCQTVMKRIRFIPPRLAMNASI